MTVEESIKFSKKTNEDLGDLPDETWDALRTIAYEFERLRELATDCEAFRLITAERDRYREALAFIANDGDFTSPEYMQRSAREALEVKP
jgi:hypothetical protein